MGQLAAVPEPMHGLVPPQNLEAEESVLGAAMLSPGAVIACREILSDDGREFYRDSHGCIWRAALTLADRGEPVDAITLADELAARGLIDDVGGRSRLYELAALVPATANAGHYARIITETAELRDWIRASGELARLAWERPGTIEDLREQMHALLNNVQQRANGGAQPLEAETWAQFERSATEQIPMLVDDLWPERGLGFIAAPPKKGKTWIGLSLGVSVATGKPFLGSFQVEKPEPVVLIALEGHRAAIRGRLGALAHGLGLQPQGGDDLRNLHIVYKPSGLNLADPAWVRTVRELVQRVGARLLIVDVLRAAAVMKENSNDEFRDLVRALQPLQQQCAIALLHHFGKLTEISRDRTPGERMSGAGAMYGAFDVGVFITKSDAGARELRVEFETRDVVAPEPLGVRLAGDTTGKAGGFVFTDAAAWAVLEAAPDAEVQKAPAHEIAAYVIEQAGEVERREIEGYFEISSDTLNARLYKLEREHHIRLVKGGGRGLKSRLIWDAPEPEDTQLPLLPETYDETDDRETDDSWVSATRGFTAVKTLDSAIPTETHESHDSPESQESESGDLQGEKPTETYDSPTERQAPADAEPATPVASDDIDWSR